MGLEGSGGSEMKGSQQAESYIFYLSFFLPLLLCSFRETCSLSKKKKTKREEMSEKRIQEEYEKLGNIR